MSYDDAERWRYLHPPDRPDDVRDQQVLRAFIREFGPPAEDMVVEGVDFHRRVVLLRVRRPLPTGVPAERFTFVECSAEGWVAAKALWLEPEARRRAQLSREFMQNWPKPPASAVY